MFKNFVCDRAYFKLYPILDYIMIFFFNWKVIWENLEESLSTLQSEFLNLLNSKSVSAANCEL